MEKKRKVVRMVLGGSGGQGVVTLGKVVAYAAMNRGLEVSCLPSYGAEMRGGYVHCSLVISTGNGATSPVISRADVALFMNDRSFAMLSGMLRKGGLLLLNTSLLKEPPGREETLGAPASELAEGLGDLRAANMVMAGMLGCALGRLGLGFELEDICAGIEQTLGGRGLDLGRRAAALGWEKARERWKT